MTQGMKDLADIDLPYDLKIDSLEKNLIGETNDVFYWQFGGHHT